MTFRAPVEGVRRFARRARAHAAWLAYAAVACACACYLNARAELVPKWGEWYLPSEAHPYILLQVRAMLHGKLALLPHPWAAGNDYNWGRGGMHTAWGLGVPLLALPFHLLGRLSGAPGFPDDVTFLVLYGLTTMLLARALHRTSRDEPTALAASAAGAGFVMVFPTFVGMVTSRFLIYELTIATAAVWSVALLAGLLLLVRAATPARLVVLCVAAGFSAMIRPPQAVYGLMTAGLALIVASRRGLRPRALVAGLGAYVASTGMYFLGNALRFGSPLATGYENAVSGSFVNRMGRWGLPFVKQPLLTVLKEQFATLFLLQPTPSQIMMGAPPASVAPYVSGERWREYYAPTYDLVILALWAAALAIVGYRVVRHRLWRRDRDLRGEVMTVVGAWALPPSIALFVFYARAPNMVTRYASDLYPAFAAASLSVGMAVVESVRRRAPGMTSSAQLVIACAVGLYISGWRGWATHLSHPSDRKTLDAQLAALDARKTEKAPDVPDHFTAAGPRGPQPVHNHLEGWAGDGSFSSAMVFAMPYTPCVSFTFRARGAWGAPEDESLAGLRATADFDRLVSCGPPRVDGDARKVTMCEPHKPAFVLDGLRLFAMATLDPKLVAIDRLRLLQIDSARSCP